MCAEVKLVNFVLEDKQRSVLKSFDDFTHPAIVRIVQVNGEYELSAQQFAKNAQFWVFGKHRQKRVVFRSINDRYISISLDSTANFHIVFRHTAGATSTLKEIFKNARSVGDTKVALDDDPDLILSNRPDLNNAVAYGELTAVAIMEETFLVGQAMNGSALESRLTLISTKAPLVLDCVVGIKKRSESYFRQWTEALRHQQIQPTPALLTSPSPSDIVLLGGSDNRQHCSLLYIVNKGRPGANSAPRSPVTTTKTHLESKVNASPGGGATASGVQQAAQGKRPDVDSLRKRFETSGPRKEEEEEDARGAQRVGSQPGPPSRALSDRSVASALPPSVSNIRSQQRPTRSLSRDDLMEACQSESVERIQLDQNHTKSLANVLGIGDEACKLPPPPSTLDYDPNYDEEAGYESLKVVTGLPAPSFPVFTAKSATRAAADNSPAAKKKSPKPTPPDLRTSADSLSKQKPQTLRGVGLHRKKNEKPPAPDSYEKIRRPSVEEHEYAHVADLDLPSRIAEPQKRRKWKNASDIPRDVDVSTLTVDEVARCLELLKLKKYARKFKERVVDGAVLVTVTEGMLVESFKMDQIDARKLVMFAKENWRPAK